MSENINFPMTNSWAIVHLLWKIGTVKILSRKRWELWQLLQFLNRTLIRRCSNLQFLITNPGNVTCRWIQLKHYVATPANQFRKTFTFSIHFKACSASIECSLTHRIQNNEKFFFWYQLIHIQRVVVGVVYYKNKLKRRSLPNRLYTLVSSVFIYNTEFFMLEIFCVYFQK